jgi:putative NIF3 family GTP cyclohydrolase 1 type 2
MTTQRLSVDDIARWLRTRLTTERYAPDEQGGVYRSSKRIVTRLGIVLEPFSGIGDWVRKNEIDAIWIHRPWRLQPNALPADVGVLFNHLPFDEHFTISYSPVIAQALELDNLEEIGYKQADNPNGEPLPQRAIGMIADTTQTLSLADWKQRIKDVFGGYDSVVGEESTVASRVAVVGAMNESLIREAAERGATLYLTGQHRPSADKAVLETGIAVIAIGHRRSEEWGLQALGYELQALVEVVVHK